MAALSRRGALRALIAISAATALPAMAAHQADTTDPWLVFADQHRALFPTIDGACDEARALGYTPDDVYAVCRRFKPTRGVFLTMMTLDGSGATEAH